MAAEDLGFRHRFLPAADPASPVLLLLHGTGGDESDLIPIGQRLAQAIPGGAHLLSPRGKVLENGMPRFFRRLAEGVFDTEDVKERAAELADFLDAAARVYGLDRDKVVAVGYSNGANIASATMLLRPGSLAAAALLRPMVPLEIANPPDLRGAAILVAAGRRDPVATPDQALRLVALFTSARAVVEIHWHPGGHELSEGDLTAAAAWLAGQGFSSARK